MATEKSVNGVPHTGNSHLSFAEGGVAFDNPRGKAVFNKWVYLAVAAIFAGMLRGETEEFRLPPVFSDHMVLQQGVIIPVWGEGPNANHRISCRLGGAETWAHSDNNRNLPERRVYRNEFWCYLPPMEAGGPYEMVLSNEVTHATKVFRDVWVGEVWLASGQSNMQFEMRRAEPGFGNGTNSLLRIYKGGYCKGSWDIASPEAVAMHSAVGTFFGNELQKSLNCAVGVLDISCGGTFAENWMSRGALKSCPATRAYVDSYERSQSDPETWKDDLPPGKEDPVDVGRSAATLDWAKPGIDLSGWVVADMPCSFRSAFGFPVNGAAWFRRDVTIPKEWEGRDLVLRLPAIDKHDIAFFDNVEIGRTGKDWEWKFWNVKRVYRVPARLVKAGNATIAIRIWSWKTGAGCITGAQHFSLGLADGPSVDLEGEWHARLERNVGNRGYEYWPKGRTYPDGKMFVRPSSWFWAGLDPVVPFAIKGAVWYQGESNARTMAEAAAYSEVLSALVADWRYQWGLGDFPFGIVQLANFEPARRHLRESSWAVLRESQLRASRQIPNAGLVNTIDIGEECDIHPKNKFEVGRRLCRWALCEVYGRSDGKPYTGPRYLRGECAADGSVRIRFSEAEGGIVADGPVRAMFVRGADNVWHEAKTDICGDAVVVSSPEVPRPVEVRYAWATNPIGATLKGKANGIPVFPFRWCAER